MTWYEVYVNSKHLRWGASFRNDFDNTDNLPGFFNWLGVTEMVPRFPVEVAS